MAGQIYYRFMMDFPYAREFMGYSSTNAWEEVGIDSEKRWRMEGDV